jgi:hypothetical protein
VKIVINANYGGFGLSPEALHLLWEYGYRNIGTRVEEWFTNPDDEGILGLKEATRRWVNYLESGRVQSLSFLTVFSPDMQYVLHCHGSDIDRDHPLLIKVVEELGEKANGACASLKVVDIPPEVSWHIVEHDGWEHVAEAHRTWY